MFVVQAVTVVFVLVWMKASSSIKHSASIPAANRPHRDQSSLKQAPTHYGENFVVDLGGCTGSVIAEDWILSAAHCFQNVIDRSKNDNGDYDVKFEADDNNPRRFVNKRTIAEADRIQKLWTTPLKNPNIKQSKSDRKPYWRKVDRLILHKNFQSEALSWKGYDLALLHMSPEYGDEATEDLQVVPVCLAENDFQEFNESYGPGAMAGFGRRRIPHCMTNDRGPEKFEVCARPVPCSHSHRATRCGVKFNYKGKERTSCITDPTPSESDPACKKFRQNSGSSLESQKTVHLFDEEQEYLTTCYPNKHGSKYKGWCVTRKPGEDVTQDPGYNKGWGFCSDDPFQSSCTTTIPEVVDLSDLPTTILDDKYCVDKLEANLVVEQPGVDRDVYDPLMPKQKLICAGRNHSYNFERDYFYVQSGSTSFKTVPASPMLINKLLAATNGSQYNIDGGPNCFGDSGGPFWRLVNNPDNDDTPTPVLVGVFSFMLWGTCTGANEPAYFGRVTDHMDWIGRYVPANEMCTYGTKFKDRQPDPRSGTRLHSSLQSS